MELIRKTGIGQDYKNETMHHQVNQKVYGSHKITDIDIIENEVEHV